MIASLIIILHLMGVISLESATTSLYIAGAILIIAEIGVVSFGLLALNGVIAIYSGYALQTGSGIIFGLPVGWSLLFAIAFIELALIITVIFVHMRLRRMKASTGKQGMIGQNAKVIEWNETSGSVNFEGEIWKAKSNAPLDLKEGDEAIVKDVDKLEIIINSK